MSARSPLRALSEVAEQLSIGTGQAWQMITDGELHAIVRTGSDALIAEGSVAEFIEAHRYDPKGDR